MYRDTLLPSEVNFSNEFASLLYDSNSDSLAIAELQSVKSVRDHTSANIAYSEYESGQSIKPRAMNGGSRVAETTSPLITHNTLIFLRCSYVGSNGSYTLATYGYAVISKTNFYKNKT